MSAIAFDERGLVPCIVQNHSTGEVLMMGWMNQEAIERTVASGLVTFFSRRRKQLWTKGETSGNLLHLIALRQDCDGDALLAQVQPAGPTCHTGESSCFHIEVQA